MTNTHHVRPSAHDAGVNRPLIWRRLHATQIAAVKVEQDEPIQGRTARTYARYGEKSFGPGNAHAYVTEAVGDAFPIENVTAVDEFLLEFFKFTRIETGSFVIGGSHQCSFKFVGSIDGCSRGPPGCQEE